MLKSSAEQATSLTVKGSMLAEPSGPLGRVSDRLTLFRPGHVVRIFTNSTTIRTCNMSRMTNLWRQSHFAPGTIFGLVTRLSLPSAPGYANYYSSPVGMFLEMALIFTQGLI